MKSLAFPFLIFIAFPVCAQTIIYVDQKAVAGAQTGADWANAFPDLQQALAQAGAGDSIWVAAGVYKPTSTPERTISFVLVDGVCLYGGFAGTETALSQRNIDGYKTVLSGDIGELQVPADNSYHVLRGKGLGPNTLLDGFCITGGYSYNEWPAAPMDRFGAGLLLEGATGMADSKPVIQNCRFEYNYGDEGGAICATWADPVNPGPELNPVNPVLRRCIFSHNQTARNGAALYKNSSSGTDTFVVEDCRFSDNKSLIGEGAGIYFRSTANSHTIIRNCLFERDTAFSGAGGAISYKADEPDGNMSSLLLDSCLFRQNVSLEGASFYYDGYFTTGNKVKFYCRVQNCRFEENLVKNSHGAALLIFADKEGKIFTEVENCEFKHNLSNGYLNRIAMSEGCASQLMINRCIFEMNQNLNSVGITSFVVNHGGGAENYLSTDITNCLFYNNGGGIAVLSGPKNYCNTYIANCTFYNNSKYIFTKTWDTLYYQPNGYYNNFYIDNCILWEPKTDLTRAFYNNNPQNVNMYGFHINTSLLSLTDSVSVPGSSVAFGEALIWGQYPGFQDTSSADFRLIACSPAVGKGDNQIVANHAIAEDLDGLPRIRYGIVDLGAYEQQDSCTIISAEEADRQQPLLIWPNPSADGMLNVRIPDAAVRAGLLQVFNLQGQEVFRSQQPGSSAIWHLALEDLPRGFYTIRLKTLAGPCIVGKWMRL